MAFVFDTEAQKEVEVPDEQVTGLVAEGRAILPNGKVSVVTPDGQAGTIDHTDAAEAFKNGYKYETGGQKQERRDEKEFGDKPLQAGLAGAARGLTLGLSDEALTATGLAEPKTLKQLKERNVGASIAGEVAGTAASLLIPGLDVASGAGLASRVGAGAARALVPEAAGLGGRLLAKAVAGAAEGTLYGLGSAISESALGDTDLTAEKLLASGAVGALTGGVSGAGLGVIDEGIRAGARAVAPGLTNLRESMQELADKQTLKASGYMTREFKRAGYRGVEGDIAKTLRDRGIVTAGSTIEDVAERAARAADKEGERISNIVGKLDQIATPEERVSGAALADRIDKEVLDKAREQAKFNPSYDAIVSRVEQYSNRLRESGAEALPFAKAEEIKRSIDPFLDFGVEQKPVQQALKQVRGIINNSIEQSAESVSNRAAPELFTEFKSAKKAYGELREAATIAEKRMEGLKANRTVSLTDYLAGGFGGSIGSLAGGPAGFAAAGAGAIANKLVRERGPGIAAIGFDKLANSSVLNRVSEAFKKTLAPKLAEMPDIFGSYRGLLAGAAARGAGDLLATHIQLYNTDPNYRETMALAGFNNETPDQVPGIEQRAHELDAVARHVEARDRGTDLAVGRFLGSQRGANPKEEAPSSQSRDERVADYQKRVDKIDQITSSTDARMNALVPGKILANAAPAIATATTVAANRALDFLKSKAPKNPRPELIPTLSDPWTPSDSQLDSWDRYVRAVDNPQSVLSDIKKGSLNPESVEALKVVYPRMLTDIRQRMMDRLAAHKESLSIDQRRALSTLFEQPMGGIGDNATIAAVQQAHAQAMNAEQKKQNRARASSGGSGKQDSYMTQSQRIEGR